MFMCLGTDPIVLRAVNHTYRGLRRRCFEAIRPQSQLSSFVSRNGNTRLVHLGQFSWRNRLQQCCHLFVGQINLPAGEEFDEIPTHDLHQGRRRIPNTPRHRWREQNLPAQQARSPDTRHESHLSDSAATRRLAGHEDMLGIATDQFVKFPSKVVAPIFVSDALLRVHVMHPEFTWVEHVGKWCERRFRRSTESIHTNYMGHDLFVFLFRLMLSFEGLLILT